uniref:Uncharacterized protein n=1 Tax=Timema poppense TaxID=170557 RepID=A0A7R9CKB9_TIMPO|nr:unnamed protein product [Timema poppensis]
MSDNVLRHPSQWREQLSVCDECVNRQPCDLNTSRGASSIPPPPLTPLGEEEEQHHRFAPAFAWSESGKQFMKNCPLCTCPESSSDLPVTGSLVYCESIALDHAATEAGVSNYYYYYYYYYHYH